ncbi:hypothetical protein QR680_007502 [Steinernema hermaphroditum]|uniref:Uncharacterized protein n=1 Tax=Steinernema hermaphroditum TaxID=289476 RepID=A0AA39IDF1_9BILA|nr:hypothetical protein QR680_007502 [Steinernema hermaphroditum]
MAPVVAYNPRIIEHGLTGIVITSPMDDEFVGAVFVDSTRPLYLMHRELFRIKDDPTMTRSRHIRMEEFFRFGDVIESVCVFRYTDFETTVYSTLFGEIDVDSIQLGGTPYQDVAIRCFVHVDYRGPNDCRFRAIRVKSIEYDDAPLVNDAPWNRSCKSKLPIYDDDSDDNYDPLGLSKPKTKREDILYKKQGKIRERKNVEDPVEVYCPPHKRERFVIGFFRTQDQNIAPETWIKFDAFWNDKTRCYIIQQYELLTTNEMAYMRTSQPTVEYFAELLQEREKLQLLFSGNEDAAMNILEEEIARVRKAVYDGSFVGGGPIALPAPRGVEAVIRQEVPVPDGPFLEGRRVQQFLIGTQHFIDMLSRFTGCTIKVIDYSHPKREKLEFVIKIRCLDAANRARVRLDIATEYVESYLERLSDIVKSIMCPKNYEACEKLRAPSCKPEEELLEAISTLQMMCATAEKRAQSLQSENEHLLGSVFNLSRENSVLKEELKEANDRIGYQEKEKQWMEIENEHLEAEVVKRSGLANSYDRLLDEVLDDDGDTLPEIFSGPSKSDTSFDSGFESEGENSSQPVEIPDLCGALKNVTIRKKKKKNGM